MFMYKTGNLCLCWLEVLNWWNVQLQEHDIYLSSPADTSHPSLSTPSPETLTKHSDVKKLVKVINKQIRDFNNDSNMQTGIRRFRYMEMYTNAD